jgi:phenylalanyl-tRNA synthetase beta subunit
LAPDLIEEVKIVDIFENEDKLWKWNKSVSIRIAFRALDRTLTNDEINDIYFKIRKKITEEIGYTLR